MINLIKRLLILFVITAPTTALAFPEIPFCPAGGPPGWMNYFTTQNNHSRWQNYDQYQRAYHPQSPYSPTNYTYRSNNYANHKPAFTHQPHYRMPSPQPYMPNTGTSNHQRTYINK